MCEIQNTEYSSQYGVAEGKYWIVALIVTAELDQNNSCVSLQCHPRSRVVFVIMCISAQMKEPCKKGNFTAHK